MNYSNQVTYGRKIVKGHTNKKSEFYRILYTSWAVCVLVGLVIGFILFWGISSLIKDEPNESTEQVKLDAVQIDRPSYGTVDGKEFDSEVSLNWGSAADLGFVPLDVPMDEELQEFIYCLSYGYNIEFSFVMALISHESSFRTNVQSNTNDYGLMQINTINHEWLSERLGITDFLDPYQNTRAGIFMLSRLFEKYEDPAKVLMAYNMGETGAKRLWDKGIFETNYSSKIMEKVVEYQKQISEKMGGAVNARG